MTNIILIGFMGTGKSMVGKRLASILKRDFMDMDEIIEKSEGQSISDMFNEKGEDYFRDIESRTIDALLDYDKVIIATGGGVVLRSQNVENLKKMGQLVLLVAEPEVIYNRVKNSKIRPLLFENPKSKIEEILKTRNPIYRSVADITIDTSNMSVDEVAREIIKQTKIEGAN